MLRAAARAGSGMTVRRRVLLAILGLLIAGYAASLSSQESGAGQAVRVIDGDTLQLDGRIIQLYGIDAPELGQLCDDGGKPWPCGVEAALALRKLVAVSGQKLHCSPWQGGPPQRTADGALVEICQVGEEDLAQVMLHNGYGVAMPKSFPDYPDAEKDAKDASLGIWHSHFLLPWVWRAAEDDPSEPKGAGRDCNVKGAIGKGGERIYYVPTDPNYKRIAIDPTRDDRLFCSDEAARLAGWTRPPIKQPAKSG
jgi:endonuclease YncB( thermonuclease family)